MNVKKLFENDKREEVLRDSVKRIRAKKGGEYPYAFGITSNGPLLIVDWRGEVTEEKMAKQMRKQRPRKMIVGKAKINGTVLELQVAQKKGTIKAKDVKNYLAKSNLPLRKALIADTRTRPGPQNESQPETRQS